MRIDRRRFLAAGAAATVLGTLPASRLLAAEAATMTTRAMPSDGTPIPVIGMGTSGSLDVGADQAAREPLREVLRRFFDAGGTLIDSAPTYGTSEPVLGELLDELGLRGRCYLATKLSRVQGREQGLAQFEQSLRDLRTDRVELLQVHNLGDWRTQLALARELKAEGRVKHVGITHYLESAHDELADAIAESRPDWVQINYSPVARGIEQRVLPVAREHGIAVMINRAFDDGRLFAKVRGKELPGWAAELGITSWGQLLLKFALSAEGVTCVIPATSKPHHMSDNLGAGSGPMLGAAQQDEVSALFA